MARAPARVSALLKNRPLTFPGHEEFSFEPPRDPAKMGARDESSDESDAGDAKLVADKLPITTDGNGAATVTLKDLPKLDPSWRSRHRGHVQRPQRRGANRLDPHPGVAKRDGAGHQGGLVGEQSRAGEVHRARTRHQRQADQGPARRSPRAVDAGHQHAQAHGRRTLRLRQPDRRARPRRAVQRQHRRARPAVVRCDRYPRPDRWS